MPYVPPGEESLKEDGFYSSPIIGPTILGPTDSSPMMPTPFEDTVIGGGTEWQFPADNGRTPVEELGPAVPVGPSGPAGPSGPSSPEIVFPEDKVTAPGMLERAGNWFSDLF